jgi:23S rRNA pseudouridine1911/1915/1917 synthase
MYGGSLKYIDRQALHCSQVSFIHPVTGKPVLLSSNLPNDMVALSFVCGFQNANV